MTHKDLGVRALWERVNACLDAHAHRSPVRRASADAGRRGAVEALLEASMPADLHEWWSLADVSADFWIPGDGDEFAPVDLDEAMETWEIWLQVADEEGLPTVDENGEVEPRFQPEYLPFAQSPGGDGLIIDLRSGTSYGAVFVWDHEQWGLGEPLWASISAMLQDVAVTLERGAGDNAEPRQGVWMVEKPA
ncbi:SMI1/KNR4 family protein [Streptomyces sp. NPDC001698]|uniref:SMI1/KNR4 family protein n=1 Tax=Streptomyces sp. NPDC001698 TaxID=3364601 RepID=UPI00368A3B8A